jgi:hypothetical protein
MRTGLLLAAAGALALAGGAVALAQSRYVVSVRPAEAASGFRKVRVERAALGATRTLVWANGEINPDCSEHKPGATLSILKAPRHGTVMVTREDDYMSYPPSNPRSACNTRKVPVNHAYYVANAGYSGRDRLVLQGSSDAGRVREITVDVTVR